MIKAEAVVEALQAQIERLEKLSGENIGGFVFILPPEGVAISYLTLDESAQPMLFFQTLNDKLKMSQADANLGGVTVPGMPRRGR